MGKEATLLLFGLLICFGFIQLRAGTIGNRSYSMYYKSHALVERKGIMKLIYFKPKHFHRYSIWEVLYFFLSYIVLIAFGTLFGIGFVYHILHKIGLIILLVIMGLFIVAEFIRVLSIDIQRKKEDKYSAYPKQNLDEIDLSDVNDKWTKTILKASLNFAATIHGSLILLYTEKIEKALDDKTKIDTIDKEFIQYYRDYKKIYINKDKVIYKN